MMFRLPFFVFSCSAQQKKARRYPNDLLSQFNYYLLSNIS